VDSKGCRSVLRILRNRDIGGKMRRKILYHSHMADHRQKTFHCCRGLKAAKVHENLHSEKFYCSYCMAGRGAGVEPATLGSQTSPVTILASNGRQLIGESGFMNRCGLIFGSSRSGRKCSHLKDFARPPVARSVGNRLILSASSTLRNCTVETDRRGLDSWSPAP
jgi:hypothetical protein